MRKIRRLSLRIDDSFETKLSFSLGIWYLKGFTDFIPKVGVVERGRRDEALFVLSFSGLGSFLSAKLSLSSQGYVLCL
jgi:hypothetical protein